MSRRTINAFLVAPLAVPLLLLLWLHLNNHAFSPRWTPIMMGVGAFVSYAGTLVFGVPAYLLLTARGFTAAWIAVAAGVMIGALTYLIISVLFVLSLGEGLSGVRLALTSLNTLKGVLWPGGVMGASVGAVLWFIGRPDIYSSSRAFRR